MNCLCFLVLLVALLNSAFAKVSNLTPSEYERICKGAISAIFSPPIDTIRVTKKEGEVLFLIYTRKSDGKVWNYKCKLVDRTVIWGAADGRWRTDPKDEKITFFVDRSRGTFTIRQAFGDGSSDVTELPLLSAKP